MDATSLRKRVNKLKARVEQARGPVRRAQDAAPIADAMVDFLTRPELVQAAKTYFTDVQLKSDKPEEFLAESDVPQVQINRDTMARFRPEMRKFYYDASKYETYLDQLGVKFPTLTKAR